MKQSVRAQRFRRVVRVSVFEDRKVLVKRSWEDTCMWVLVALPFLGALVVLAHVLSREKETYYVPIKAVRR